MKCDIFLPFSYGLFIIEIMILCNEYLSSIEQENLAKCILDGKYLLLGNFVDDQFWHGDYMG